MTHKIAILLLALSTVSHAQVKEKNTASTAAVPSLNLTSFLEQVKSGNEGFKGAKLKSEGALERTAEADLLTAPSFFLDANWAHDKSEKANQNMGRETIVTSYKLGLQQQTPFGLTGRLFYDLKYTDIQGANSAFAPKPTYYDAKPVLEGSLSLWRNLFGKEVRSSQEAIEASAKATAYSESFVAKATLAEAEGAYWRLAIARRLKQIAQENLDRAQKLRDWYAKRAVSGLGDNSELLQADGNLKFRRLEYKSAQDEERVASLMFNSQRGLRSDKVEENLEALPDSKVLTYQVPVSEPMRDDVRAALEGTVAARAASEAGVQKNSPTLELYGTYTQNGLDREEAKAKERSFTSDYPTSAIGVRFNVPLEVIDLYGANRGYGKEALAADYKYQRKIFEQKRDWGDLVNRYSEARERLSLSESYEATQKEKFENERERHRRGRTTTFMVLQFEQDYAVAQATRLRLQGEVLGLISQLKLYGENL